MFKIGDIVRPKKGFIGHNYCFKIIESEINPFDGDLYKLQRVEQGLDSTKGPLNLQLRTIRSVEIMSWREKELELTSDVKLRYDITDINIPDYTSIVLDEMERNLLKLKNKVKEEEEMKILDLYESRKKEKIEEQYKEEREKIINQDTIQNIITEMQDQVNAILEEENSYKKYRAYNEELYTEETEKELKLLDIERHKRGEELRSTLEEIRALFELTDDYEQRIKILKKYGILNKDGKLNI